MPDCSFHGVWNDRLGKVCGIMAGLGFPMQHTFSFLVWYGLFAPLSPGVSVFSSFRLQSRMLLAIFVVHSECPRGNHSLCRTKMAG
jgi:hypothetical protein